jgi:glycogen synthase
MIAEVALRSAPRVLMIGWEFPPRATGSPGRACEGLVRGLLELGCRISLVLPRAGSPASSARSRLRRSGDSSRRFRILRFDTRGAGDGTTVLVPGSGLGREVLRLARRVSEIGPREDFDVIHGHDWMTFPAALELRRITGKPFVAHVHSTEFARNGEAGNPFAATVEREGLRRADRVVCVSRRTAGVVRRRYDVDAARLRVVHSAIEPVADSVDPVPHDGPLVLFVGPLTRQKAPAAFLEAAARVLAQRPEVEFVMAGNGDRRDFLIDRARELGIQDSVRLPGLVPSARLEELYRRAAILAVPAVAEPFGLAVLEAARAGVPSIVSRQAGVTEVLSSLVPVEPGDANGLADRILFLLDRPIYRWMLGRGAADEVRTMTWNRAAARCLAVYAEVC